MAIRTACLSQRMTFSFFLSFRVIKHSSSVWLWSARKYAAIQVLLPVWCNDNAQQTTTAMCSCVCVKRRSRNKTMKWYVRFGWIIACINRLNYIERCSGARSVALNTCATACNRSQWLPSMHLHTCKWWGIATLDVTHSRYEHRPIRVIAFFTFSILTLTFSVQFKS